MDALDRRQFLKMVGAPAVGAALPAGLDKALPPHGWNDGHAAWNEGRFDKWVPNKGVTAMTYHTRGDLPYQFALADAFTVCDNYHCSLLGPTDPNRYHMWSGWVGNDGAAGGPVVTNAELGYDWSTYPERLERNGIAWKIYQDVGLGLTAAGFWGWTGDPYIGNYGDNSLLYFHQYQNAQPGNPLADRAKTGTEINKRGRDPLALLTDFRDDVRAGRLPQVSWIVAPEAYTEHPNWEPGFGAWYVSQVIDILAANPEVWSKMALFVTFLEARFARRGRDLVEANITPWRRAVVGDLTSAFDFRNDARHLDLTLEIRNRGGGRVALTVRDAYRGRPVTLSLRPGETRREKWSLDRAHGWYDLTVTVTGDAHFEHRFAGHVENGEDSISDPAMGGLV